MPFFSAYHLALCFGLLCAGLIPAAGRSETVNAWLGDAGHFLIRAPIHTHNPTGKAFDITVHRHVWAAAGDWANRGDYQIRILGPDGEPRVSGTIPSGDGSTTLRVPAGDRGVYTIDVQRSGYGLTWLQTSLPHLVAGCGPDPKSPRGLFELHAMTPRRWYFYVPAGVRRFKIHHVIIEVQTHRENYGFLVVSPRGQRVDAFYGGKPHDMSPTSGDRAGFPRRLEPVVVTREIEVDAGADGKFWSLWVTGGDSHNFSDLTLILDGVPPYFATSPEQWFDPRSGEQAPRLLYDQSVIRVPDIVAENGSRRPPYPRYFGAPTPFLGDEDYNGWRGAQSVWLYNPENRAIEMGIQTYLASTQDLESPVKVAVAGPSESEPLLERTLALDDAFELPRAGGGVYRIDIDGRRWFPWTHPVTPIVIQGQPAPEGGARFALETGIARQWYFKVPSECSEFSVTVAVKDPDHVLKVEIHAPDRMIDDQSVRGGHPQTVAVTVPPHLAGRIWFVRLEIGSATRFVSGKDQPGQLNIEADLTFHGVPGYLAPTWEQGFDPASPERWLTRRHPASGMPVHWASLTPLPTPRHDLQLIAQGGMLYAISGAGDRTVTDVQAYDPGRKTWTSRTSIPGKRGWFGAALIDNVIYCAGGKTIRDEAERRESGDPRQYQYLDSLNIYDPATDRWRIGPPMRAARAGCQAAALNGEFYVIGGSEQGAGFLDRVEIYNPATGSWRDGPPFPEGREDLGAVAVDGKIYVIGGVRRTVRDDVFIFDPQTAAWTHGTPMPTPRRSFAIVAEGPRIWCLGGIGEKGYTTVVEGYDTRTDQWITGPPLPRAQAWMGAAAIEGRLFVAGGADYDHAREQFNWLDTVWMLDPEP